MFNRLYTTLAILKYIIMKKLLISFIALAGIANVYAQANLQEFEKKLGILNEEIFKAYQLADYRLAENKSRQVIKLYSQQSPEVKDAYKDIIGICYYQLGSIQSKLNKKNQAIKNLEQACENGFQKYMFLIKDPDWDNVRTDKRFKTIVAKLRETGDYIYMLQKASPYIRNHQTDTLPRHTYLNPNHKYLVKVRQYFKLDSVAGSGDEISKIKNILTHIHNTIRHDGASPNPSGNSIAMAEACKDGSRGLNCGGLAAVLEDCYLAMGFKAKLVSCMPKVYDSECHSINTVYSNTLDKWIWMDPTNNAWVTDENGQLLGISEVRERLRANRPLKLNKEANWNNLNQLTKEGYLDEYMSKNLYCFLSTAGKHTILLTPPGFTVPENYPTKAEYVVSDDEWFWQSPYQN